MPGESRPTLRVGLAGWNCRLAADTPAAYEELARVSADWAVPEGGGTTGIGACSNGDPFPRLFLTLDGRPGDFAPFFSGPGGKRFVPLSHPSRRLYADLAVGDESPVLELCPDGLTVLRPDLWPFYVMQAVTWRLLCEHPVLALHAAVCAAGRVALVVVGPSGSGKSTLCWALVRQGADYFSDECAFFDLPGCHLHVRANRVRLRPGGVAQLDDPPDVTGWHESKPGDPKFIADLPAPRSPCPEEPALLLFIQGFADTPSLTPISGGEATRRVTRMMGFGDPSPLTRLETAADLVSRLPCRALTLGRPRETAEMLMAHVKALHG